MARKKRKTRKEKKRLMVISVTIIILLLSLSSTLYKNFIQIIKNKKETAVLKNEYESLLNEKDLLKSEIMKMQDPDYIARYAKEKYFYSSDGEYIIKMDE